MKKFTFIPFTFSITVLVTPVVSAQITVNQTDMPSAGVTVVSNYDLSPIVTPGSAGAGITWNFSALKTSSSQTTTFVNASSTPYSSFFPLANLADSIYDTAGYTYFSSTTGAFSIAGRTQISGYTLNAVFNPVMEEIGFPANYQNNIGDTSRIITQKIAFHSPPIDSIQAHIQITYADTLDAWGTITTPSGSYSALREKHYELDIDSLFIYNGISLQWSYNSMYSPKPSKIYEYVWFAHNIHYPVAQMTMDSTGKKVVNVLWYEGPLGINNVKAEVGNVQVFPNPCTTQVTFRYSGNNILTLSVFDITGRQLIEAKVSNDSYSLNTSGYASGIYIFQAIGEDKDNIIRGKFSVQ